MDVNVQTMVHYLQQTINPDASVRREAESFLNSFEHNEGFLLVLFNIMLEESLDRSVRQAAAVAFKNAVKRRWSSDENSLCSSDKQQIKRDIVSVMLHTPQYVQKQLCEAISSIAREDFPQEWSELLPSLVENFSSSDFHRIQGVLRAADPIFWKYRYEERSDRLWMEIKHVLDILAKPLTDLFGNCITAIEQASGNANQLSPILESTELILQIFYSLNYQDLPSFFEDHMEFWMNGCLTLLQLPNIPELDYDDLDKPGIIQHVKGQVCTCISLYAQKYDEEFETYLHKFVDVIWHLLTSTGLEVKNDYLVSTAMNFLTSAAERKQNVQLFAGEQVLKAICEQVVVPNMFFREADEENFECNPEEFIRRDIEGSDIDTRRRAACDLVRGLCKYFESEVTNIFSDYVSTLLETYRSDPANNWKSKDAAIFLVTSLAVRSKTASSGTTEVNEFINIEDFFRSFIASDIKLDSGVHPVILASSIKYVLTFRGHLSLDTITAVFPSLIHHLTSQQCVINSYASACIERILAYRRDGKPLFTEEALAPQLEQLLTNLFHALTLPENSENEYIMKAVMRTIVASKSKIIPYIMNIVEQLATRLIEVAKNPGRPRFNHFMFEAFGSAIRFTCSNCPDVLEKFEAALFPPFELLLTNDIEEFQPYIFQLLAQLLELRSAPVPDSYMALYPHLTSPALWESGVNASPLVRFIIAYLKCSKGAVCDSPATAGALLGVFQKLIASRANDHEGFNLLQAIVAYASPGIIDPYMEDVFRLILTRMTNSRTTKLTSNFITFVCFLAAIRSPNYLFQITCSIDNSLFPKVINRIVEDVQKVTGQTARKTCVIGMTSLLSDCSTLLSQAESWNKLLEAALAVIELPEEHAKENAQNEDDPLAGTATGNVQKVAMFNRLVYAGLSDNDYFSDVHNIRSYLAQKLQSQLSQHSHLKLSLSGPAQQQLMNYLQRTALMIMMTPMNVLALLLVLASIVIAADDYLVRSKPDVNLTPPIHNAISAATGIATRVLGKDIASNITFEEIPPDVSNGHDVFEIETINKSLVIRGNTAVAMASGLYWYMRYHCNSQVTWGVHDSGRQINVPIPLPEVKVRIRKTNQVRFRYYMNVCTVSYSMVWWNWTRWEKELDWMALHGINLPLAFTGQEYIWYKFYRSLGLTADEILAYFSGPAFLAWNRMGNLKKFAGPLDTEWRQAQFDLQLKLLKRSRELGMINALPGFAGHVPRAISRIYPNISLTRTSDWSHFNDSYSGLSLLEPTDPLFITLGKKYYEILIQEFGTDHVFQMDTYNEMPPITTNLTLLTESNRAIFEAMTTVDPEAVYLMQGWLFHEGYWTQERIKAYLAGVPNDRMIILDLNTEASPVWDKTQNYYGKLWIWNMLLNYGGRRGLYGNLTDIATRPLVDLAASSSMDGMGITPEAIENNPVMFELMLEMPWHSTPPNVSEWVAYYTASRYGGFEKLTQEAWQLLQFYVYSQPDIDRQDIDMVPNLKNAAAQHSNATAQVAAWRLLCKSANTSTLPISGPFSYDLVDVGRQVLINFWTDFRAMLLYHVNAYNRGYWREIKDNSIDRAQVEQHLRTSKYESKHTIRVNPAHIKSIMSLFHAMLELMGDLDTLLGTDPNYMLGNWLESSKAWGTSSLYEYNARNQITLWGPVGEINDYAAKHWNGLVKDYYLMRWTRLYNLTHTAINASQAIPLDLSSDQILPFEQQWTFANKSYPVSPQEDVLNATLSMIRRYASSDSNYTAVLNQDVQGFDIAQAWSKDLNQLKILCDSDPLCKGFNSNGWLKYSLSPAKSSTGTTFYVKE